MIERPFVEHGLVRRRRGSRRCASSIALLVMPLPGGLVVAVLPPCARKRRPLEHEVGRKVLVIVLGELQIAFRRRALPLLGRYSWPPNQSCNATCPARSATSDDCSSAGSASIMSVTVSNRSAMAMIWP